MFMLEGGLEGRPVFELTGVRVARRDGGQLGEPSCWLGGSIRRVRKWYGGPLSQHT